MRKIFLLFITLFVNFSAYSQLVFPAKAEIIPNSKQVVFDFSLNKCDADDLPDVPARAFRDIDNKIQLIASHIKTFRMIGTNFDNLTKDCSLGPIFTSGLDADPAKHNDNEWIMSTYTTDGKTIHGIIHNEFHGWEHGQCNSTDVLKCWWNTMTYAVSTDTGKSFKQDTSNLFIAGMPYKYKSGSGPAGIFGGSNIIYNKNDKYYYITFQVEGGSLNPITGITIARTQNLSDSKSWRFLKGSTFSLKMEDVYKGLSTTPVNLIPTVFNFEQTGKIGNSITFNTYFNKYLMVGGFSVNNKSGFYYTLSSDLINWSKPQPIAWTSELNATAFIGEIGWGAGAVGYPSIIDHSDTSRNFEYSGQEAYLYYTRVNASLDRDLERIKIRFNKINSSSGFIVSTNNDSDDYNPGDGKCETFLGGPCSFRAALEESNFRPLDYKDSIFTIKINTNKIVLKNESMEASQFPILIDGFQNGGGANTNNFDLGMNLVPGVEIDCNKFDGLFINGGNSTIRGLNIYNYSGDGGISLYLKGNNKVESCIIGADKTGTIYNGSLSAISIDESPSNIIGGLTNDKRNLLSGGVYISGVTSKNNLIQGNYIGTDITGTKSIGVPGPGIQISAKANTNTIGGTTQTARNLISGNSGNGIEIFNSGSTLNKVLYNFIGVDRTGKVALGNKSNGVEIDDAASTNTIGQPGAGNVIGGNGIGSEAGIYLSYSNDNNIIQSNFIGTDTTQSFSIPNKNHGIAIADLSNLNKIGSLTANSGNVIANNFGYGIFSENYTTSFYNSFIGNLIYDNNKLDIDLAGNGINKNDTLDKDTGPNYLINSPLLEKISIISNGLNIKGSYLGEASKNYFIEFFASQTKHPSGFGNAKKLVGSTTIITNSSGNATFDVNITTSIDTTYFITSLATNYTGTTYYSTSEFSRQLKVGKTQTIIINNSSPKITSKPIDPFVVTIGTPFSFQFNATDKDTTQGDELNWSVTSAQAHEWFSIDNTGKLTGNPDNDFGDVDWWDASIKVSDLSYSTDVADIELIVNPTWPKITSTPLDTISPTKIQNYQIEIKDESGNAQSGFTFTVVMNPGFVTVNTTGLVKIAPVYQHAGFKYYILLKATKGTTIIYQGYVLDVKNVNIAPLWEDNRKMKIPNSTQTTYYYSPAYDTTIHKDSLVVFRIVPASDYNKSDTLIYTYKIYDAQSNTLVTSIIADKYNYADSIKYGARETRCVAIKNLSQVLQVNTLYECKVEVTDGTATASIPTPYPRFKLSSSSNNPAITTTTTQLLFGKVQTGSVSATQSFKTGGSNLTGNITITPPTGFEVRTGTNNFSANAISLTQTSGVVSETNIDVRFAPTVAQNYSGSIKISSLNANDKTITVSGDGTTNITPFVLTSDSLINFANTTVGKISDTLSFTISGGNISDTLKITSTDFFEIKTSTSTTFSKLIKIKPVNSTISETKIEIRFKPIEDKEYSDTIKITSTNLQSKIIVKGTGIILANNPPTIKSIAETIAKENQLYTYQVIATDADSTLGDTLKYELENNPTWLTISKKGLVSGLPIRKNVGDTSFTVKVTDLQGAYAMQKNVIKVLYQNSKPIILSKPDTLAQENEFYSYLIQAIDPDSLFGDKLNFDLIVHPTWLTLENNFISGTPSRKNVGDTIFTIKVSDLNDESIEQKIFLKVKYLNKAPLITSKADTIAVEDSIYNYQVIVTDADSIFGDKINFSLTVKPQWLSISNSGLASGIPRVKNIGDTTFTIKAEDLGGLFTTQTIKLKIKKKSSNIKFYQIGLPETFNLSQNYPNPFNPSTTIRFAIPKDAYVKLEIYNSLGQMVETIIDKNLPAHFYEVKWEAGRIPSGLYFYKLIAIDKNNSKNNFVKTMKMMLMK